MSMQTRIREGLQRAAQRTAGATLEATIARTSGADETVYPPTPGTTKNYTAVALFSQFDLADRDGTQVTTRDVLLLVSVPLVASDGEKTEPTNGDKISVSGVTYDVVSVNPVQPGGDPLMWQVQARAADG